MGWEQISARAIGRSVSVKELRLLLKESHDSGPTLCAPNPPGLRGTATKLNTFLEYPLENLDMSPFLSARAKAAGSLYDLYGVVVHKGDFKVRVARRRDWVALVDNECIK